MSRVLFISNFLEKTGWGQAARGLALAMDIVGIDVVCRNINMGGPIEKIEPRIYELLDKSSKDCDICIQHVLPQYMVYDGNFKKNIGSFVTETENYQFTPYLSYLEQMDELWVANDDMLCVQTLLKKYIPCYVVPHAFDSQIYQKYEPLSIPEIAGDYKFYFIGEANRRKHLSAALQAFHLEFSPSEPVSFVIKAHRPGLNPQQCNQFVSDLCNMVKTNLKLYNNPSLYKSEIIITNHLNDSEIYKLHNTCDCYLSTSYGEAWSIPAFEAACFGNSVIATNEGGPKMYLQNQPNSYLCDYHNMPCFGMIDTISEVYTGRETCKEINILELRKYMRIAYEERNQNKIINTNLITKYSLETVGNIIKERLNESN